MFGGDGEDDLDGGDDLDTDYVNGGDGDDTLIARSNDVLSGGQGQDMFVYTSTTTAEITDFETGVDKIFLNIDDTASDGSISIDKLENDLYQINLDGTPIASVLSEHTIDLTDIDIKR